MKTPYKVRKVKGLPTSQERKDRTPHEYGDIRSRVYEQDQGQMEAKTRNHRKIGCTW